MILRKVPRKYLPVTIYLIIIIIFFLLGLLSNTNCSPPHICIFPFNSPGLWLLSFPGQLLLKPFGLWHYVPLQTLELYSFASFTIFLLLLGYFINIRPVTIKIVAIGILVFYLIMCLAL